MDRNKSSIICSAGSKKKIITFFIKNKGICQAFVNYWICVRAGLLTAIQTKHL
jgi:hypothetical protein